MPNAWLQGNPHLDFSFWLEVQSHGKSAKQYVIDASTMEAEFVTFFEAIVYVLWLQNFILGLGVIDKCCQITKTLL